MIIGSPIDVNIIGATSKPFVSKRSGVKLGP